MTVEFKAYAAKFGDAYKNADTSRRFPEGKYTGEIVEAKVAASKFPGNPAFNLELKFLTDEGRKASTRLTVYRPQMSDGFIGFLKGQLEGLGYTGPIEDLADSTGEMIGRRVKFEVKHEEWTKDEKSGTSVKFYFNGVDSDPAPAGVVGVAETAAPVGNDDDIPF